MPAQDTPVPCVQDRRGRSSVQFERLFEQRTRSDCFIEIDEVLAKSQVPRNGRLAYPFIAFRVGKSERQCQRRALTDLPRAVGRDRRDTDGIEAATQENSGRTVVKAAIDRPIEDLIEARGLLAVSHSIGRSCGKRIPIAIETQVSTRYDGSPAGRHASHGCKKSFMRIWPAIAQVIGKCGTIERA